MLNQQDTNTLFGLANKIFDWENLRSSYYAVYKNCFITLLASSMLLSGCSNLSTRQKNAATGAAIGGVAGAVLTGGSAFGTVGGAAIGGVIGHGVDGVTSKKK